MLQHPGNRISLESYDVEEGFCALMHTHEGNHMGRILSPSKGTSGCLSRCFSYYSFSVSVTPSQVPHQLLRPLTASLLRAGLGCCCELQKSSKALHDSVLQTGMHMIILLGLALTFPVFISKKVCVVFVKLHACCKHPTIQKHLCLYAGNVFESLSGILYPVPSHSASCPKPWKYICSEPCHANCYATHEESVSVNNVILFKYS